MGRVRTGRFSDAQSVVRKALDAMREVQLIDASNDDELRRAVREGIDALEKGHSGPWDPDAIKAAGRHAIQQRSTRRG